MIEPRCTFCDNPQTLYFGRVWRLRDGRLICVDCLILFTEEHLGLTTGGDEDRLAEYKQRLAEHQARIANDGGPRIG